MHTIWHSTGQDILPPIRFGKMSKKKQNSVQENTVEAVQYGEMSRKISYCRGKQLSHTFSWTIIGIFLDIFPNLYGGNYAQTFFCFSYENSSEQVMGKKSRGCMRAILLFVSKKILCNGPIFLGRNVSSEMFLIFLTAFRK